MDMRRYARPLAAVMLAGLVSGSLVGCGEDESTSSSGEKADVTIEMKDFSFAVSGTLTEGGAIEFTNTGKELHMVGFGKFKPGKGIDDVKDALKQMGGPEGGEGGEGEDEGAAGEIARAAQGSTTTAPAGGEEDEEGGEGGDPFAEIIEEASLPGGFYLPGTSATVTTGELEPGTYGLICFIPGEGGGPPHALSGMVGELTVEAGDEPAAPKADATYTVDKTGKVSGPASLDSGPQTIAVKAGAGADEQEAVLVKPKGDGTFESVDKKAEELYDNEDGPPKGAASMVPADFLVGLFDFAGADLVYLTVDLEPGTYYFASEDSDDDDEEYAEPLKITVK